MNVLKEFTNIVYVGRGGGVRNPQPGTIYIDKAEKTASWLCPCGCGHQIEVKYKLCKPHELPYDIDKEVVNLCINDEGEVSMSHAFHNASCPNHLLYCISNNNVKVFGYAGGNE